MNPSGIGLFYLFYLLVFSTSCYQPDSNVKKEKEQPVKNEYNKPPSSYSDTLVISGQAIVFFNADSIQLGKIKDLLNEMEFESDVHDCTYQIKNVYEILTRDWPDLKILEAYRYQYLLFKKHDNTSICINLNEKNDMCGVFLFDEQKEPELADMTNIETALNFYFNH